MAAFVSLAIYDRNFEKRYLQSIALKELNEKEIRCLDKNDCSGFRDGNAFIDHKHDYSFDLDIFEPGSLFQHINRTASAEGEERLAQMLLCIEQNPDEIKRNTEGIKELSKFPHIRQLITILGIKKQICLKDLLTFSAAGNKPNISPAFIIFARISVCVTIATLVLYFFKILPSIFPFGMFIFQLVLSLVSRNKINSVYGNLNNATISAGAYADIAQTISGIKFESEKLLTISANMMSMEKETKKLKKILNSFDSRNNGLIYIVINGFFLRDIFSARKTALWFKKNAPEILGWERHAAEFDAISSLGGFAFNNQTFVYPEISCDKIIEATNMCHPLIPEAKRVGNDITVNAQGEFFLITGANMAGKSTFIRSIGINMVLASCGAPVCADSFKFRPSPIFTSMRTSDKLLESASYFQAELARLQLMKDKIESNDFTLILLDEILKGTNSDDKLKGSILVLTHLIKMKAAGLVSTHDTALHTLEEEMPKNFHNYSFEFEVSETGELVFDYKLHRGVSRNMNAGILLKRIFN